MDGFEWLGFLHCIGTLDGTHIPIVALPRAFDAYFNRKKFNSIVLQGTCDHFGHFVDIELGWLGKTHDSHAILNSALCKAMDVVVFVPSNPTITLIVADAAYPITEMANEAVWYPRRGQAECCV